jgi:hypothetical protein
MGGIFGGQGGAGAQALPAMSGFDANAVAQALQQAGVGNNPPTGMTPGVPQGMTNPLAQMLAAQGPTYQPSDTTWGIKGDRLLRYTPQEGNRRDGDGAGGGAAALPGSTSTGLTDNINWGQLGAHLDANGVPVPNAAPNPTGDPKINAAMEKLKTPQIAGERPANALQVARDAQLAWQAVLKNKPGPGAIKAEKAAWQARRVAAEQEYLRTAKATGYGPGADPYNSFANVPGYTPGSVGAVNPATGRWEGS